MLLAVSIVAGFAVLSNDSFGLQFQGDHLSLSDPASLYNAFFPIGYPVFLRAVSLLGSPLVAAVIVQIVCAGLFAFYTHKIAISILPRTAALIATVVTLLLPGMVRAELSAVPDFFAALFVLLAINDLFEARPLLSGIWLGAACLFRFHALAFAIAVLISVALMTRERRALGKLLLGFVPLVLLTVGVHVWSAPIDAISGTAFNLWKTMHGGTNWIEMPKHFDRSVFAVIASEPSLFLSSFVSGLLASWYVWVPIVLFLAITVRRPVAAIVRAALLAALLYHIFTIPGGSARGPIVIAPLVVFAAVWSLLTLIPVPIEAKPIRRMILALVGGFSAVGIGFMLLSASGSHDRIDSYDDLAHKLNIRFKADALRLFTDDFALYFPALNNATPRVTGGWPEIGLPTYRKRFAPISDTSAMAFYDDLKREHISFVAIRESPIDNRAFEIASSDSIHFSPRGSVATYHVFDVK